MGFFAGKLRKYLPEGAAEKDEVGGTLAKLGSVNELLADTLEATEKLDIVEALRAASPWAEAFGSALGDALPPVKFVLKLFGELTKIEDPHELGYLAATLAYQRAVEQAWSAMPQGTREKLRGVDAQVRKKALAELRAAAPEANYDFSRFTFADALSSAFVRDADGFLEMSTRGLGLEDADFRILQREVRHRFVPNLKGILSHGSTREKFAPFRESMKLESLEARAYDALLEHADYQRWLFEEYPVLGHEPFTLAQVYTDLDCGVLRWQEIHRPESAEGSRARIDAFDEEDGGRHPLIETVLDLIADPNFRDAIVIQGVAGSGKSSFTLRLAWELVRQGLRPIRIELKHLDVRDGAAIEVALPEAVRITSRERDEAAATFEFGQELFRGRAIFKESILFRGMRICPYVLVLDGWDEIKISGSEGYQLRIDRMLDGLRQKFLGEPAVPIRVVIAGRPSYAIEKSKFLRDDTRILTVRDLSPDQLETYVANVETATSAAKGTAAAWSLTRVQALPTLLGRYRRAYEEGYVQGGLKILGLPLLAHLAMRLLAERPDDATELLANETALYRNLVDLVVGQAARPAENRLEQSAMIQDPDLRQLLRRTAEAMTTFGSESIPYEELALRLDLEEEEGLQERAQRLVEKHYLSRLMISFFFRGGRKELGAEFSHKSFREYLFAEQVVEELKAYGREAPALLAERSLERPWQDFDPNNDPRHSLSRRLAELLGSVWLTTEVTLHLQRLLVWEIGRAGATATSTATPSLERDHWQRVRDGLADIWEWWGHGVHLRPQPAKCKNSGLWQYEASEPRLILEVVKNKRLRSNLKQCPEPLSITAIDAHLGEGLCLLAGVIHTAYADQNWPHLSVPRRFQSVDNHRLKGRIEFRPGAGDRSLFIRCCARINAEDRRRRGNFPSFSKLRGADLSRADLRGLDLRGADLRGANLRRADLRRADFSQADLRRADLSRAYLRQADLRGVDLLQADLSRADLSRAELSRADLSGVDFRGADLSRTDLSHADLRGANLRRADLRRADLRGADLRGADLLQADLLQADLRGADLRGAYLVGTLVDQDQLKVAILNDSSDTQELLEEGLSPNEPAVEFEN